MYAIAYNTPVKTLTSLFTTPSFLDSCLIDDTVAPCLRWVLISLAISSRNKIDSSRTFVIIFSHYVGCMHVNYWVQGVFNVINFHHKHCILWLCIINHFYFTILNSTSVSMQSIPLSVHPHAQIFEPYMYSNTM